MQSYIYFLCPKKETFANRGDKDQMLQNAVPDLDLHCLTCNLLFLVTEPIKGTGYKLNFLIFSFIFFLGFQGLFKRG